VELTERGRQVTQSAMLIAAEITAATLAAFSEDERRQVTRLLKKLG
jgi:DNA-binding MarR family transcriptional regulator